MQKKIIQQELSESPSTSHEDACESLKPGENDVLLGRGGGPNNHPGNIKFRKLVHAHKIAYMLAPKSEKPNVARQVVQIWRQLKPQGRFLARCDEKQCTMDASEDSSKPQWYEVGDKKAREKTSQCLREVNPDILPFIKKRTRALPKSQQPIRAKLQSPYGYTAGKPLCMVPPIHHTPVFDSRHFLVAMQQNVIPQNVTQSLSQSLVCLQFNPFAQGKVSEAIQFSKLQRTIRHQEIIRLQQSLLKALKQQH